MNRSVFHELPASAAWRHVVARDGFEVVFITPVQGGWRFVGHASAVEDGRPWTVRYEITVDRRWCTRRADVSSWTLGAQCERTIRSDGSGRWEVNGAPVRALDGCLDVDLEASALTNTFPVHRLSSDGDGPFDSPAAYVRVANLAVERLEQRYTRQSADVFDYEAPAFGFTAPLRYDGAGLVVDYPGIALRVQ